MTGPNAKTFTCTSCVSRSRCVLSAVEPEILASSASRVQWVGLERGGPIIHEGTPSTGWVILCHGRTRLTVSTEKGKRLHLRFYGPGELLSASLSEPHGFSVTAVSQCIIGFVAREHVLDLGRRYPELLFQVHQRFEETQRHLATRLVDLAYGSTRQRLVRVLLELGETHGAAEQSGVRIDIPLSLRDLAEMIGAARPTTSAELQALVRRGLIRLAWPTVFLLDPDGLRRQG